MIKIDKDKISSLVHSQGWKEFKKLIKNRKIELAMRMIDNPEKVGYKEKIKIKAFEECITIAENIVKKEELNRDNMIPLGELPKSLE